MCCWVNKKDGEPPATLSTGFTPKKKSKGIVFYGDRIAELVHSPHLTSPSSTSFDIKVEGGSSSSSSSSSMACGVIVKSEVKIATGKAKSTASSASTSSDKVTKKPRKLVAVKKEVAASELVAVKTETETIKKPRKLAAVKKEDVVSDIKVVHGSEQDPAVKTTRKRRISAIDTIDTSSSSSSSSSSSTRDTNNRSTRPKK